MPRAFWYGDTDISEAKDAYILATNLWRVLAKRHVNHALQELLGMKTVEARQTVSCLLLHARLGHLAALLVDAYKEGDYRSHALEAGSFGLNGVIYQCRKRNNEQERDDLLDHFRCWLSHFPP